MNMVKSLVEPFKLKKGDERLFYFTAKVLEVLDGDTVLLDYIDLGFNMAVMGATLRLNGIDAPEIHSENEKEKRAAELVRDYVKKLTEGQIFVIKTLRESAKSKEKFGRYLCELYLSEGETISKHLIDLKFARAYKGEKKQVWTDAELDEIIKRLAI